MLERAEPLLVSVLDSPWWRIAKPIKDFHQNWSGKRDSNSRPRPWQGRALPTELFPLGHPSSDGCRETANCMDRRTGVSRLARSRAAPARRRAGSCDHRPQVSAAATTSSHTPISYTGQPEQVVAEQHQTRPVIWKMVFHLAEPDTATLRARAELRHPFAQRGDRDLAADDHDGGDHDERSRVCRARRAGPAPSRPSACPPPDRGTRRAASCAERRAR